MSELKDIALVDIVESPIALRTVVEDSEKVHEMLESVRSKGVIEPIQVRLLKEGKDIGKYCIINGLHRFTCAKRAGMATIPARVMDVTEAVALEDQIVTNIHRVDTKPVEYAKALKRMLSYYPLMTMAELAAKIFQSTTWISERFNLLSLPAEIQHSVDAGEISLTNAFALSKLPPTEVCNFLERAMTLPPGEFVPLVDQRKKEIQAAKRTGSAVPAEKFVAIPVMRKPAEVKAEFENPAIAGQVIASAGATSPESAFAAAIAWVLKMDSISIADAKAKHNAREKAKFDAAERRSAETLAKKVASAQEKVDKLKAEADEAAKLATGATPAPGVVV